MTNTPALEIRQTQRPRGGWRWQRKAAQAIYLDGSRRALWVSPTEYPLSRGEDHEAPARGHENEAEQARSEAETVRRAVLAGDYSALSEQARHRLHCAQRRVAR